MYILKKDDFVWNVDNKDDADRAIKYGAVIVDKSMLPANMIGLEHLVTPANTKINPDGTIVFTPPKPPELNKLKARKLNEINAAYQQAIAEMTPGYPDDERLTFDKQEQEARAWLADDTALTPFIDALAAGRQMDKAELVKRIIAKADAFALASGSLTGQRQRYEDLLKDAQDAEAVAAIVPQYSLPGMEAQA